MKQGQYIEEDKLLKQGIDILMEQLGPIETSRFLSFPVHKRIESVKRHKMWQSKLDKNQFFDNVFENK
ncbi:MAG: hypothetical protein B6D35_06685 [Candidatus Brocadia sp. UTAMX2]|jgi:hypothetical protein|nr:MAG: hypothetical protein B6D35_06685 [Candidatus Brocadia sp. UTAMX2]